mgnify:CR=1 FL=1
MTLPVCYQLDQLLKKQLIEKERKYFPHPSKRDQGVFMKNKKLILSLNIMLLAPGLMLAMEATPPMRRIWDKAALPQAPQTITQDYAVEGPANQDGTVAQLQEIAAGKEDATLAEEPVITTEQKTLTIHEEYSATDAAPTEDAKDKKDSTQKPTRAYRRGLFANLGLAITGYNKTKLVLSYLRDRNDIPVEMLQQLESDRKWAITDEQVSKLQAGESTGILDLYAMLKHNENPLGIIGEIIKLSMKRDNFKIDNVKLVEDADALFRAEDARDLLLLSRTMELVKHRMTERKTVRAALVDNKPAEADVYLSDDDYADSDVVFRHAKAVKDSQ